MKILIFSIIFIIGIKIFFNIKKKNFKKLKTSNYKKTTYKEKIEKGKNFEEYIAKYYKFLNYKVIEHGKIHGKKDQGIDIIATNEKENILIQCKNYNNQSWKIRQKDIKAFRMDCLDFIQKNKQYKNNTKIIFILSGNFIDNGAKKYIEEKQKENKKINYKIIDYC